MATGAPDKSVVKEGGNQEGKENKVAPASAHNYVRENKAQVLEQSRRIREFNGARPPEWEPARSKTHGRVPAYLKRFNTERETWKTGLKREK